MSSENSEKDAQREAVPDQQLRLDQALAAEFTDRLVRLQSHSWKAFGLTYGLRGERGREVFQELRDSEHFLFDMLIDITAVDWMDRREPRFDVVYHLLSLKYTHRLCVKVEVSEAAPEVDSVVDVWPAAHFLEREVWDMYGISFRGHENLRRILMYEEFEGHPLRKDYPLRGKQPRVEMRIPELRNTAGDMQREQLVSLPVRQRPSGQEGGGQKN